MKKLLLTIGTLITALLAVWLFRTPQPVIQSQTQETDVLVGADSGARSPGTMADDATVGTIAWANPDNAKVNDNVYAIAGVDDKEVSHYLKATNFGFSIPTGATINGIVVEVERKTTNTLIHENSIKIVKGGTISGDEKSIGESLPITEAYKTYGSSSDLWGLSWSNTDINSATFGFVFSIVQTGSIPKIASVDHIRITVYYTMGGATAPQPMNIIDEDD